MTKFRELPGWWTHPHARGVTHPKLHGDKISLGTWSLLDFMLWTFLSDCVHVPSILSCIKYQSKWCVSLNSVSNLIKLFKLGRECWEPPICSQLVRSTTWQAGTRNWCLKLKILLGTKPLTCGVCITSRQNKVGLTNAYFKTHCKDRVIKSAWIWNKERLIDQWNRITSPEINLYTCGQLIFNNEAKTI